VTGPSEERSGADGLREERERASEPSPGGTVDHRVQSGRLVLFGFEPTRARVRVLARPRGWRVAGAARSFALGLLAAPLVAVVPPHAPWAIGALVVGSLLARRRWSETHTLEHLEGSCRKCGSDLGTSPTRLKRPHPIECESCLQVSALHLDDGDAAE